MTTYLDRKGDVKPIRTEEVKPFRKGKVKPMASSGVDRKDDVNPVKRNGEDRKDGISGDCRRKKQKLDDGWVWYPDSQAQSLEQLTANNVSIVSGQLHCSICKSYHTLQYDLQTEFHKLQDELVAHRQEFRILGHTLSQRGKTICPNCGKTGMSPVMPDQLQPWETETKTLFDLRKVDNMDMLFLLLGKFLRFCSTEELHAVGLRLGLSEKCIPAVILPRGMTPKQAYIIALHYRLARILDPSNPCLNIGSWPFRNN